VSLAHKNHLATNADRRAALFQTALFATIKAKDMPQPQLAGGDVFGTELA
jgi:hypothetical protein